MMYMTYTTYMLWVWQSFFVTLFVWRCGYVFFTSDMHSSQEIICSKVSMRSGTLKNICEQQVKKLKFILKKLKISIVIMFNMVYIKINIEHK